MKKLLRPVSALMLAVLLVFCAAGCGGQTDANTFTVGTSTAIDTLNPLTSYETSTYEIFSMVYDTLVTFDENQENVGRLAESWEVSGDGLVWTFRLREGVKWHDGQPFTSDDVKYTYELMMETGLGYMYEAALYGISAVECPDEYTVVVTTEEPKFNMLYNRVPILPRHYWEAIPAEELETAANSECIGTGPFKFDSQGDGFLKLVRNADYFGQAPKIESLVWVNYENVDSMAQALKLGEIDAAMNLSSAQVGQLEADENISVIAGDIPGFIQIGINCYVPGSAEGYDTSGGNPLLLDKDVRAAIEYCTDRQKILDMVYGGHGTAATTIVSPGSDYHLSLPEEDLRAYSPAKAAEVLEAAGYADTDGDGIREADGQPLQFEFITIADNTDELKAAQIIAAGCKEAGIQMDMVTMDSGALGDKLVEFDFDCFIWGWGAGEDPAGILSLVTTESIGGTNEPGWSNSGYDELYAQLQIAMDEDARIQIAHDMQRILYDEAPYILLLYDKNIQAYRSDLWQGVQRIPAQSGAYFMNYTVYNYVNVQPA